MKTIERLKERLEEAEEIVEYLESHQLGGKLTPIQNQVLYLKSESIIKLKTEIKDYYVELINKTT